MTGPTDVSLWRRYFLFLFLLVRRPCTKQLCGNWVVLDLCCFHGLLVNCQVVILGCHTWLSYLVVILGCHTWLSYLVVILGCHTWLYSFFEVMARNLNSFLRVFRVDANTTSSGSLFQQSMSLCVKKYYQIYALCKLEYLSLLRHWKKNSGIFLFRPLMCLYRPNSRWFPSLFQMKLFDRCFAEFQRSLLNFL